MTCLWDKSWDPDEKLPGPCDWVACLKPPRPPASTNLRITDWDGDPIAFGDSVHYVCDRGFSFEEDPDLEEQIYTCQDGTAPDTVRGFFDVPQEEDDWPRCVRGKLSWVLKTSFIIQSVFYWFPKVSFRVLRFNKTGYPLSLIETMIFGDCCSWTIYSSN